jgi:hypothetical protein
MKTEVEDWLTELPPLDGDDDEPEAGNEVGDDPLPELEDASSLDDAVAEDLDVDISVEIPDDEPADAARPGAEPLGNTRRGGETDDERWEADVGEPELDLVESEPPVGAEGEPTVGTDDDFDDHEDLAPSEDDAGEEGTTDPIEHSLDEELPAMDADDEGDFEDALLLEVTEVAHNAETLRWADAAWSECSSLKRSFSWTAGENDPLVAISSLGALDLIVAIAESGALWVSRDGGRTAARARGVFEHLVTSTGDGEPPFAALGKSPGGTVLWVGNAAGQIAASHDFGDSFQACSGVGRPIVALATREDGSLVVLARKGAMMELLASADGATWFTQRISGDIAALASPNLPRARWMTCRGVSVAVGDNLGALQSRDGRHFVRVPATAGATAGVFAGSDSRAPLVLSGSFGDDDELHLVRVPHEAPPEIVAEVASGAKFGETGVGSVVLGLSWLEEPGAVTVLLAGGAVVWGPPGAVAMPK